MTKTQFDEENYISDSPLGQLLFRLFSPSDEMIINCAMVLKYPIELQTLKNAFLNSILIKHPRFSSLIVRDKKGRDYWKRTHVNIDDHIFVRRVEGEEQQQEEAMINAYLAEISVSTPLSKDKPLWEVHLLEGLKCVVLRVHHAIGDGVSLMSMLNACFGGKNVKLSGEKDKKDVVTWKKRWRYEGMWGCIKSLWFTSVFLVRYLGRLLWVKDKESVISGGDGVEIWPRKVVTAKFMLEDVKSIKTAIPNVRNHTFKDNDLTMAQKTCTWNGNIHIVSAVTLVSKQYFVGFNS